MVSLVVHLATTVLLGLLHFPDNNAQQLEVVASLLRERGEQLDDTRVTIPTLDRVESPASIFSIDDRPREDVLADLPPLSIHLQASTPAVEANAFSLGLALDGRQAGAKQSLLAAFGGSAATENAVQQGLAWLRRNQRRDGRWSLTGPYANGAGYDNPTAATAMALLAFLGSGQTHEVGPHREAVQRGVRALLEMQDADGNFFIGGVQNHRLYSQALATIVVCELYGMTRDEQFREPAQRALDYAARIQADDEGGGGGWRYYPRDQVDTSVTGWFVMALESGKMAQLVVGEETLEKVSTYLDHVTEDGIQYRYRPLDREVRLTMSAEALLCRQYSGWAQDDTRLVQGARLLNENPINWEKKNVYYWYYASQVLHHLGGDAWHDWNQELRDVLPRHQESSGREQGSWNPYGDPYGADGGRLYFTCFCLYNLEVYYRHLPIYR